MAWHWRIIQTLVISRGGKRAAELSEEIKFWIMSRGSKALVLEPESLEEEIRSETLAMVEKYGNKRKNP